MTLNKSKLFAAAVLSCLLSACAASQSALPATQGYLGKPNCESGCMSAVEAVTLADAAGTQAGVDGTFLLEIKAVGQTGGRFFLNSEEDYRDRNCLTIAVPRMVMNRIVEENGFASADTFRGKQIVVEGTARKVRIDFLDPGGRATGKYYYQIHVRLNDASQIRVLT